MPQPSEQLTEIATRLTNEREMLESLQADYNETKAVMEKELSDLAKWSREETEFIRKVAMDPDNKQMREYLDTLRGNQLVTRESHDSNQKFNLSREEMLKESRATINQLGEQYKRMKSTYINQVYEANKAHLIAEVREPLVRLLAMRFITGMNLHLDKIMPRPGYIDDIDSMASEIKAQIEGELA